MKTPLFLLLALATVAEITKDNGVLVLTDQNFDEAIEANPNGLLVELYAPWCGHCKKLVPEYEAAAKILEPHGLSIAKIDATEHKTSAGKYGVKGFPTLKYISKDSVVDYAGGRVAADISSFVLKKNGPPAVSLDSKDAVESFTASNEVAVVGFFADAESSASKEFIKVASSDDSFMFGVVNDLSVVEAMKETKDSVVIYKKFDDGKAVMDATGKSSDEIISFIKLESMRLVTTFSMETSRAIFAGDIKIHALFFADKMEGELLDAVTQCAKDTKGKILHVHIRAEEQRVIEYFGLTKDDLPTLLIADMTEKLQRFPLGHKNLTLETIKAFETDFMEGKLTASLKSEEPKEEDLAGPVKIIKGKSFDSIVINNEKDVFVEFYAPWCGHCKKLAPLWEELATKVANVDNLVIANMDATANEVSHDKVNVSSFPTLLFFPAKDKANPIPYPGGREVEPMLDFLKKEAADSFAKASADDLSKEKKDEL